MICISAQANIATGNADILEMSVMESSNVPRISGSGVPGSRIPRIEITGDGGETALGSNGAILDLIWIGRGGRLMQSLILRPYAPLEQPPGALSLTIGRCKNERDEQHAPQKSEHDTLVSTSVVSCHLFAHRPKKCRVHPVGTSFFGSRPALDVASLPSTD